MEYESPNPPRTDPVITVESDASGNPVSDSRRSRSAACRHRLRWRDLSFGTKYRIMHGLGFSVAALAVAIVVCVIDGVYALSNGLVSADGSLFFRGCLELFLLPFLVAGPIAFLRIWWSPHRPERATVVNHSFAMVVLIIVLGLTAGGREWMVLLAFPAFVVRLELRDLRRVLTDRSTCATDSTLPIALRTMTPEGDRWPVTDEQRAWIFGPRVVEPGFDSWRCPHALFWDDLRRKAKLGWLGWAVGETIYWMGLMLTFAAMFLYRDRLLAASPVDLPQSTPIIACAVLAYMLQLGNRALRNHPLLHRTQTAVYVWGTAGHVLIALLAAGMAVELDRPYLWAVPVLALFQAYLVADLLVTQTPWSRCAAEPELHRSAQAALKPGRGAPFLNASR